MQIDEIIAKGPMPFEPEDSDKTLEIVEIVENALSLRASNSPPMGTSELCRTLRPQATKEQTKNLIAWLRQARESGQIDNCFSRGAPAPGTFGKPRILWKMQPKVEMTQAERDAMVIESIRIHNPDLYEKHYATTRHMDNDSD